MLYELTHTYLMCIENNKPIYETKLLGVFDDLNLIDEAILHYLKQPGFSEYVNNFCVRYLNICPTGDTIFLAGYSHIGEKISDDVDVIFGYFDTEKEAQCELDSHKEYFSFYNDNEFVVDEYLINRLEWTEGFD